MNNHRLGYAFSLIFVLLSAIRDFGIHDWPVAEYFLILAAFLPPSLVAGSVMLLRPRSTPWSKDARRSRWTICLINCSTLANWAGYIWALTLINPALAAAIVVGGMPMSMFVLLRVVHGRRIHRLDLVASDMIDVRVAYLYVGDGAP